MTKKRRTAEELARWERCGKIAPAGECKFCDEIRETGEDFFPRHTASDRCESGHRAHCTCDTCF